MRVYIDIETAPPLHTLPDPSSVEAPDSYKDPRKIHVYKMEKAYPLWAKQALHPAKAQVIIVGAAVDDGPIFQTVSTLESDVIRAFDAWLEEHAPVPDNPKEPSPVLVAYNGFGFDFPVLMMRAIKYKLPRLARRMRVTNKWGDATHKDPFAAIGLREGKLFDWASLFGIGIETEHGGGEVFELIRSGRHKEAMLKNSEDVRILREVDKLLTEAGVM